MLDRLILAGVLGVSLAACGGEQSATPAAGAVQAPDPLSIRLTGVGPIGDGTPFQLTVIRQAFPRAKVDSAFLDGADEAQTPILTVIEGGTQMLEIQGGPDGEVSTVLVQGADFVAPGGEHLMTKWTDAKFRLADCVMGEGRFLHAPVCRRVDAPQIAYVFAVPGWTSDTPPPVDVLASKAFIREFVWTANPR